MLLIGLVTVNRCGAYLGKNGLFGELLCNTVLFLINVASTVGFSLCFIVVIASRTLSLWGSKIYFPVAELAMNIRKEFLLEFMHSCPKSRAVWLGKSYPRFLWITVWVKVLNLAVTRLS